MNNHLLKLELRIKNWIYQHRLRIYLLAILSLSVMILPTLPYLKLFIEFRLSLFIVFIFALLALDLSFKQILFIITLLFLVALFFFVFDEPERAENLGNYIYSILLVWVFKEILKIKSRND